MAQFFTIHLDNPQPRLVRRTGDIVRGGGVIVLPTDSCYALACRVGDKAAMERVRSIRGLDARHHFGLLCRDLAEASVYARIDDRQFRLIKNAARGDYAFILQATRVVPRRLLHARRKTIGVRMPAHRVVLALLAELGEPLVSSTLILPGDDAPLNDPHEIRVRLEHQVELVLDAGSCGTVPTTVVDLTTEIPVITRQGKGSAGLFGAALGA